MHVFSSISLIVGGQVKVKYYHTFQHGAHDGYSGRSRNRIDSFLSAIEVCCKEALSVQNNLQNEFFSVWNEVYKVKEYVHFDLSQTEELIRKIVDDNEVACSNKLRIIKYASSYYEQSITYRKANSVGYWILVLLKEKDFLCAFSCLFEINIEKDPTTKRNNFDFRKNSKVGDFCRYKILKELQNKKLVSRINDVSSLDSFSR